jgi:hypothetical protein
MGEKTGSCESPEAWGIKTCVVTKIGGIRNIRTVFRAAIPCDPALINSRKLLGVIVIYTNYLKQIIV